MAEIVRIRIYVDYLNLFWRVSKHYEMYWVDIEKLVLSHVREKIPNAVVESTRIFVAPFSNEKLKENQLIHLRMMKANSNTVIIDDSGFHKTIKKYGKLVKKNKVINKIARIEFSVEKRTDVNIAAQIVEEAYTESNLFDLTVLVSQDTDLVRALEIKKEKKTTYLYYGTQP